MKYQPLRKADPNQAKGLRLMRGKEKFALLMAMRTRKTKVVLDDFGEMELDGEVKDMAVVAPAGCYRTWEGAMAADLSEDIQSRMLRHTYSSSANARSRRDLETFMTTVDASRPRVLLMNVEALSRPGPGREVLRQFVGARPTVTVIDESTSIKGSSRRTEFINRAIRQKSAYRRIMSGLATPRSPLDLFHQFWYLDPNILGFHTRIAFMKWVAHTYAADFGGRWLTTVIDKTKGDNGFRPEALAELRELIDPHSFRVEFNPKTPPTYSFREVEMTKEQAKAYREIRDFATTELANNAHVTATVVIAQLMRMHQVLLGHVGDEHGNLHHLPENRTAAILEELEDYGGKAVIWFAFVDDLHRVMAAIEEEYGKGSVAKFLGDNIKTREAEEARFKSDPQCRFMGATAGSGGRGRAWHVANRVIYHSSTDDLEKREQSEQRAQDRDKEEGVDYVDMIVPNTVEGKIINAIRKKIDMSSAINGDNYREWLI